MTLLTLAMPEQLGHVGGRSSAYPLRATHTTTEYIIKDGHKQFSKMGSLSTSIRVPC